VWEERDDFDACGEVGAVLLDGGSRRRRKTSCARDAIGFRWTRGRRGGEEKGQLPRKEPFAG